jgi:polyhydroxyalkanoate synthesis repressor PhaR
MAADEPVLIKRYANRKLYDQSRSRYVTLEELEELIRQGREVRVVDAVSGEDLTSQTLAQIILENARGRRAVLPAAFLHQLIKHGEAWQSFVQDSLQASLTGIVSSQREAERVLREWQARAGWWPNVPASPPPAGSPKPEPEQTPAEPSGSDAGRPEDLRAEVASLKARLRDLETRLGR